MEAATDRALYQFLTNKPFLIERRDAGVPNTLASKEELRRRNRDLELQYFWLKEHTDQVEAIVDTQSVWQLIKYKIKNWRDKK